MLSIHCKVVLLLVAGQPDSLPAHTVIYFFYFLCSITFEACRNQKQTRPDMRRQTHLAAQTPVWPSCNWLNCSWTWRETRSDPPSQETTLRLWISHISKAEGGNRRTYKEGSSFSLSLTLQPSDPPPGQAVGRKRSNCLWKQKRASPSFPRAFHMINIHPTSACMCLSPRVFVCEGESSIARPAQTLYN